LDKHFSTDGRTALKNLRRIRCGQDPTIRDLLDRTRNLVTFHYLRSVFEELLSRAQSKPFPVEIRYDEPKPRRWYPLAEHLKIEECFGIDNVDLDSLQQLLNQIVERLDEFAEFLDEVFTAYKKERGLEAAFVK